MKNKLIIPILMSVMIMLLIPGKQLHSQQQIFQPTEDAFVRGGSYSNDNYHNHEDGLYVKQGTVNTFFRKAFVKFDVTEYNLDQVGTAKLRLYCYKLQEPDVQSFLNAYEIPNDWSESTITWENAPAFIANLGLSPVVLEEYLEIDVTQYVSTAIANAQSEVSFGLYDGNASNNGLYFHNKLADNPPQLLIDEEAAPPPLVYTDIYYVDAENGNDENDGLTQETAWQTLDHINDLEFGPGAQLLFKAGQGWHGSLEPIGTGAEGNPIIIGKYGEGDRPAIHGGGVPATIRLRNMEYIILRDLEITNYDATEEDGKSLEEWENWNVTDWFEVNNPPQYVSGNSKKMGVLVTAVDMGEVNQIHLINLHIHGVNGDIDQSVENTKNNGGIAFEITGVVTPTWFNDLLLEGCHIHDVDRTGFYSSSSWDQRTLTTNENWTPSLNVVIRNNVFERSGANALILRVAQDPLLENNLFCSNGIKGSGNAAFNFNTDGAVWQYNEARFTKKNQGDHDAGGLDSDFRSKNTIIQYNYLHDNDYGMLVTGGRSDWGAFNDITVVRYNIFEREGLMADDSGNQYLLRISGNATNTYLHNNVFYVSPEQPGIDLMYHRSWGGLPDHTYYFNNIYYLEGTSHSTMLTSSTNNHFFNNLYFGHPSVSWPPNTVDGVPGDPLFDAVGAGPEGYRINESSPAINKGISFEQVMMPDIDYFGNNIPETDFIDIGAHQLSAGSSVGIQSPLQTLYNEFLTVYPMPVKDNLTLTISNVKAGNAKFYLIPLNGSAIYLGEESLKGTKGEFTFNLSGYSLQPGMYAIKVELEDKIVTQKLIYTGR